MRQLARFAMKNVHKKKNHLELARWALLRWWIMKAIGYNSAVINFMMKGVIFKRALLKLRRIFLWVLSR